jgi:hypothetical protein
MIPDDPASPTWKVVLNNYVKDLVSLDFFVVPMVHMGYCLRS